MSFLKNIFGKKDQPITSYQDFWNWFQANERVFFTVVKRNEDVERNFLDLLSPKLNELRPGYYFLTGMFNDNTAELIFTADGDVKNFVFVEELVNSAPTINGWKFTAHKPPLSIQDVNINMGGYNFNGDNISFYANDHSSYPDKIDITIVHSDLNEQNKTTLVSGVYIFLDHFLGELNFATTIDNLNIVGTGNVKKELVPIEKLKDYLIWREKEFVEKYEGVRYNTENDNYSALEAELENGNGLIAVVNTDLLHWDSKSSHPWIMNVEIKYDGSKKNGMPDESTFTFLSEIEEEILADLKDFEGYLNIGRQTAEGIREIYFACKDFRKPSKVLNSIVQKHPGKFEFSYDIYKDKYWQSFDRFINA